MPLSFDALSATTYKNYRRTLADNIMKKVSLLAWLRKAGQIERREGGIKLVEPLLYGLNNTFTTYRGYDVLPNTPQTGITAAEYDWKKAAVSITISRDEEMQNSGESRIINLLKSKIQQAEKTFQLKLDEMMFGDGTGNGGRDFSGLNAYITTSPSTAGGIDGATNSWWDNVRDTCPNFATDGLKYMRSVYNQCTREGDEPKVLITHRLVFEAYESMLTTIERINYSKGKELAGDLGFETLMFKGKPIMWDYYAPALTIFFVNSDYLKLVIDPRYDFEMSEWRVPVNQMAKVAYITTCGELVCSNRQVQGRLSITALS